MLSRELAKSNDQYGWIVRESEESMLSAHSDDGIYCTPNKIIIS